MGKSSKNFKRPTKKEKEQIKLKKSFTPRSEEAEDLSSLKQLTKTITKKFNTEVDGKKLEKLAKDIVEEEKSKVVSKHEEHQEKVQQEDKPKKDYVDLMFGKKTYKPLFTK